MADIWNDLFDGNESHVMRLKSNLFGQVVDQAKVLNETMTQSDIAKLLKLKQPHVSDILHGRMSRFSLEKVIELAERLNMEVYITTKMKDAVG